MVATGRHTAPSADLGCETAEGWPDNQVHGLGARPTVTAMTGALTVRALDPWDDELLGRYHGVIEAATLHQRPGMPTWTLREIQAELRHDDGAERSEPFAAFDGGQLVGAGAVWFPLLDNTWMVWGGVFVPPERRRRGIGTALAGWMANRAEQEGRTHLVTTVDLPIDQRDTHPYRRFAEHVGYAVASVEIRRRLALPVDPAMLDELAVEAAQHHSAYRIEAHTGLLPDHLLPSYCAAAGRLAIDAPTGDLAFEQEALTPEVLRQRDVMHRAAGRERLATVALDAAGQVVAYNDLIVPEGDYQHVDQWGTLVVPEHRGHRLGLAVKVAGLRELARRHPERTGVYTTNSEVNGPMIAINERLGFRPIELAADCQRILAPARDATEPIP